MPARARPKKAPSRSRAAATRGGSARKAPARKAAARRAAPARAGKAAPRKAARAPAPRQGGGDGAGPRHTVTAHLQVEGAADAIAWYQKAFGAKELARQPVPGGKLMHAAIQLGDATLMLADRFGPDGPQAPAGVTLHIHHRDIDRMWRRALDAGAQVVMPLEDQFWGDRYGKLRDPFGFTWSLGWPSRMGEAEKERKRSEAVRMFAGGAHPGQ